MKKMSESKSEMTSLPVGNLRNRIDNNLKLSIPKPSTNFNTGCHSTTAPVISSLPKDKKPQISDFTMVKNIIKNIERNDSDCSYFSPLSSPSSVAKIAAKKRKFKFFFT